VHVQVLQRSRPAFNFPWKSFSDSLFGWATFKMGQSSQGPRTLHFHFKIFFWNFQIFSTLDVFPPFRWNCLHPYHLYKYHYLPPCRQFSQLDNLSFRLLQKVLGTYGSQQYSQMCSIWGLHWQLGWHFYRVDSL
jgi:hypothetical protein